MIADEEAVFVDLVGGREVIGHDCVEVAHHWIPREVTGDDRPAFDPRLRERVDDLTRRPASAPSRTRENPNQLLSPISRWMRTCSCPSNTSLEIARICSPTFDERGHLLHLFDAEGTGHLERSDVVAREDEAKEIVERVARLVVHEILRRQLSGPPMRSQRRISWWSCSSSVRIMPPSMVEMWCEKNALNVPMTPTVPAKTGVLAPSDSQLSSRITSPCSLRERGESREVVRDSRAG